jgi:TolB protein
VLGDLQLQPAPFANERPADRAGRKAVLLSTGGAGIRHDRRPGEGSRLSFYDHTPAAAVQAFIASFAATRVTAQSFVLVLASVRGENRSVAPKEVFRMCRVALVLAAGCAAVSLYAAPVPGDVKPPLLVVSNRSGSPNIFLVQNDGSGAKNLTENSSINSYPTWSPDGKKVAFASDRDGTMNVYVMDADGKNVKALTSGGEVSRVPTWSGDGKSIAFCRATPDGSKIFVAPADGGEAKAVGDGDGWDPAFSPDGKKIAFASLRGGNGFRVYVMDADGGNLKEISTSSNPHGYVYPAWSPDGKKLAWSDSTGDSLEIYVGDADGKNIKQLTKNGGQNTYTAWSPNGKEIAFYHTGDGQSGEFRIIDADGGNARVLLKDEAPIEGGRPAWRPK